MQLIFASKKSIQNLKKKKKSILMDFFKIVLIQYV